MTDRRASKNKLFGNPFSLAHIDPADQRVSKRFAALVQDAFDALFGRIGAGKLDVQNLSPQAQEQLGASDDTGWIDDWTPVGTWTGGCTYAGRYRVKDGWGEFQVGIAVTAGITPTATQLRINLPAGWRWHERQLLQVGSDGNYNDVSAATSVAGLFAYQFSSTVVTIFRMIPASLAFGSIVHNSPVTWAAGDSIGITFRGRVRKVTT